jgi:hypothetical protein
VFEVQSDTEHRSQAARELVEDLAVAGQEPEPPEPALPCLLLYPDDERNQGWGGDACCHVPDGCFVFGCYLDCGSCDPAGVGESRGEISWPYRVSGHDLLVTGSFADRRGH